MPTLTAAATDTLKSYNPATGELVGEVPATPIVRLDPALLEQAVRERSIIDLRSLDLDAIEESALQTEVIEPVKKQVL